MNHIKGGGSYTSYCPICGLHFRIIFDNLQNVLEYYDGEKFNRNKKKTKIDWSNNRDKIISNFDKLKKLKKITFNNYNKITLLLPNGKVKHGVKYDDASNFMKYGEIYFNKPLYSIDSSDGTKGLPMHTECWQLAKTKYNHELKFEDFLNNKNQYLQIKIKPYLFDSINYGVTTKYESQDWNDNFFQNIDSNAFLLNEKDWHIIFLPSGESDQAKTNSKRIEKILEKIIQGIKIISKDNSSKNLKNDRPSPSESATLFPKGTKKKGNDGNMYIVDVNKNKIKKWKKFVKENKDRPSPAISATEFKEGTKKKGNDGNIYIVTINKNGVKRWIKFKK